MLTEEELKLYLPDDCGTQAKLKMVAQVYLEEEAKKRAKEEADAREFSELPEDFKQYYLANKEDFDTEIPLTQHLEWYIKNVRIPTPTEEMMITIRDQHPNEATAQILNVLLGRRAEGGASVLWNTKRETWFVWNGKFWDEDARGNYLMKMLRAFLYKSKNVAVKADINGSNKDLITKITRCQAGMNIKTAMIMFQSDVATDESEFDKKPMLFNCANGTLNLETFILQPFKKEDFLTRISPVEYDPTARFDLWDAHLNLVIPDQETKEAFQIFMGYTLMAGNRDNLIALMYGGGKNGKSETVAPIKYVHGKYALTCQATTFYEQNRLGSSASGDIARMANVRLISVAEGGAGKYIDEGIVKQLSGNSDPVTARFPYGREFEFIPTAKIVFHTNHLPKIRGADEGIWRRIFPIPFTTTIPPEKRVPDYSRVLIGREAKGILRWMVIGLQRYNEVGNKASKQMERAKAVYKQAEDVLADFLAKYKIGAIEHEDGSKRIINKIKRADLYDTYKLYCKDEHVMQKHKFNSAISERLGRDPEPISGELYWIGIRLKTIKEQLDEAQAATKEEQ